MTSTHSFDVTPRKVFELTDVFTFGKYKGNTLEDVIHDDYAYFEWCFDNLPWFKVSEEVYESLTIAMDNYRRDDNDRGDWFQFLNDDPPY